MTSKNLNEQNSSKKKIKIFRQSDNKNPTKTTKSFDFCSSIKNAIILVHLLKEISLYVALKAHKRKKKFTFIFKLRFKKSRNKTKLCWNTRRSKTNMEKYVKENIKHFAHLVKENCTKEEEKKL